MRNISAPQRSQITASFDAVRCAEQEEGGADGVGA